jgi:hypothetical protein
MRPGVRLTDVENQRNPDESPHGIILRQTANNLAFDIAGGNLGRVGDHNRTHQNAPCHKAARAGRVFIADGDPRQNDVFAANKTIVAIRVRDLIPGAIMQTTRRLDPI